MKSIWYQKINLLCDSFFSWVYVIDWIYQTMICYVTWILKKTTIYIKNEIEYIVAVNQISSKKYVYVYSFKNEFLFLMRIWLENVFGEWFTLSCL